MRNKLLIAIFIFLLIGPNIIWKCMDGYIDIETTENRTLAEKPDLSLQNIFSYPQLYENYFNDHLAFKSQLVKACSLLDYKLFHIVDSEKVLLGKENWLFYKSAGVEELADEQPISDYQGINKYNKKALNDIAGNINTASSYLAGRNIEFSVLICPNKEHIYSNYLPDSIKQVEKECKADELVKYLKENTDTKIIYPLEDLLEYKDNYQLYYKYDTHWNSLGGFVATQSIIDEYLGKKEFIDNHKIISTDNEAPKDLAIMLNMSDEFSGDKYYLVDDYKNNISVNLVDASDDGYLHVYNSNAEDKRTIMVIRDSYGEALRDYLSKDFKTSVYIHRAAFNQEFIDIYQPDIVIYEVVERATDDIYDLSDLFGIK